MTGALTMRRPRRPRRLTPSQLHALRDAAVAALDAGDRRFRFPGDPGMRLRDRVRTSGRILTVAPEDLVVACNMALGHDRPDVQDADERDELVETYRMVCADAWANRHRRLRATRRGGPRATRVLVAGSEFAVRIATVPCAGCGEVVELRHGDTSRRAMVVAMTGIGVRRDLRAQLRSWWADE